MGVDVELKVQNLTLLYWKSYFDKITLSGDILFDDENGY